MEFEFEYTGYMDFENEEDAKKFGYEMEKALGFLTKDNLNLYLTERKVLEPLTDAGKCVHECGDCPFEYLEECCNGELDTDDDFDEEVGMTKYDYEKYSNNEMSELLTKKYEGKIVEKIEAKPHMMVIYFTDKSSFTIETNDLEEMKK